MSQTLKLVILGGGTAGWMAANLFAARWKREQVHITLVESPDIGIIGVGEGSTPSLKRFFNQIGVAESEWMPLCNATYKLNIRFTGWSPDAGTDGYSHPFFSELDSFKQNAFFINCHMRRLGLNVHTQPDDFFINAQLAQQFKGPHPSDNFPFNMEYGYHFDSQLLGAFLAERAKSHGIHYRKATVVQVVRRANGDISSLQAADGENIEGDFFVDCSGFASLLMQKTLCIPFHDFNSNLFNDSAVVMPTPITEEIPVETRAAALSAGWCWKIPLTNRFGNGYVYSSDFISKDQAETEFRQHLGMENSAQECRHIKMRVGQLQSHWSHNCIGLGLSQGFIEPLEATALHLVQTCIEVFMDKFEQGGFSATYRSDFNREMNTCFEHVRNYIVAHYKLNTRNDSGYWRANRNNMHLSDSLLQILDAWYRRVDLAEELRRQNIQSHFGLASWHCLLAGYGTFPELLTHQPDYNDQYLAQQVQHFLLGCSRNFSSHSDNLKRLSSASGVTHPSKVQPFKG